MAGSEEIFLLMECLNGTLCLGLADFLKRVADQRENPAITFFVHYQHSKIPQGGIIRTLLRVWVDRCSGFKDKSFQ